MSKSGQAAYRAEFEPINLTPEERGFVNQPKPTIRHPQDVGHETTSKPVRGFPGLCCPKCGAENAVVLSLSYVEIFSCTDCDEEWGVSYVREMVDRWSAVLAWVDQAPIVIE